MDGGKSGGTNRTAVLESTLAVISGYNETDCLRAPSAMHQGHPDSHARQRCSQKLC